MPIYEHRGHRPQIHPSATIAPTAVLSGDVRIGADVRVLHGAVLTAEDGVIDIGAQCVVMENALVRARKDHHVTVGRDVLIGPHVHLNGANVGDGCFLGTGAALFPGAVLAEGVEVRIHGVVHVNTHLQAAAMVPIGWVAVGAPASILPPDRHEAIWAVQEGLNFPGTVYGVPRGAPAGVTMARQSKWYAVHSSDRLVAETSGAEDAGACGVTEPVSRQRGLEASACACAAPQRSSTATAASATPGC